MNKAFTYEVVVSGVLIILSVLLLNPFHFWMPDVVVMCMLALVIVCFALCAIFIMKERVQDERETLHRMYTGRVAFLIGSAVMTTGIVVQALDHVVDVWLVVALVLMILSKFATRLYCDKKL